MKTQKPKLKSANLIKKQKKLSQDLKLTFSMQKLKRKQVIKGINRWVLFISDWQACHQKAKQIKKLPSNSGSHKLNKCKELYQRTNFQKPSIETAIQIL